MIPLRDQIPTRTTPFVNYALIAVNIVVFIIQFLQGPNLEGFVQTYAVIPTQFTTGVGFGDVSDLFTSMFMHAGIAHIGGNMLYLWIFGDNVEDTLGHGPYLLFYLFGGVVASLAHMAASPRVKGCSPNSSQRSP